MTTSDVTRKYWIEKAKGWAEERLSPPQADEFVAAINEVMAENEQLLSNIEFLSKDNARLENLISAYRLAYE